jgi:hypothetical protein
MKRSDHVHPPRDAVSDDARSEVTRETTDRQITEAAETTNDGSTGERETSHEGIAQQVAPTKPADLEQLRIYSHSSFLFWWPVWVTGYVMAVLTYLHGQPPPIEEIGQVREWFHPSNNLGVVFFLVLFLVILITNFSVRGIASGMVIMGAALLTVVLAYIGWWDQIFSWFGGLKIHLTLGAYFWFSTLVFVTWIVSVFGIDRLSYWEVTPNQLTHKTLLGAGSRSYNAQGMGLEKHRDNLFRHWLLGLGSGDLEVRTSGATLEHIAIHNVLFIGWKVDAMQQLIAQVPE